MLLKEKQREDEYLYVWKLTKKGGSGQEKCVTCPIHILWASRTWRRCQEDIGKADAQYELLLLHELLEYFLI